MILRYILYWPVNIVMVLLSFVLSPALAALSMAIGKPTLPGVLQWFSTTDNTLDGGINDHVAGYDPAAKGWKLWWQRTCWICRNPAHGFQSNLLGMSAEALVYLIKPDDKANPRYWLMANNHHRFFMWKREQPLFAGWYLKIWLGWLNVAYDGVNCHYQFNVGLKRR